MKKFNTFDWKEVPYGESIEITSGRLHVRATEDVSVIVEDENGEAIAGTGRDIQASFEGQKVVYATVIAPEGTRVFMFERDVVPVSRRDVVFTNVERMPMESGTLLEVKKELRSFQLQQQGYMRELRAERAALRKEQEAAKKAAVEPDQEPGEEPVEEPAAEPAAE